MKKIPKLLMMAIGLLSSTSGCDKKVKPATEQINSCLECGGNFTGTFYKKKAKLNYDKETKDWKLTSSNLNASVPCKFPVELLIENKEIIFDGKFKSSPDIGIVSDIICIEKIY